MEEVLFESEQTRSREDIAASLRQVADSLASGGAVTLRRGEESVTLDPPASPTFEVKAEREGSPDRGAELSVEFEIEWREGESGGSEDGELRIE